MKMEDGKETKEEEGERVGGRRSTVWGGTVDKVSSASEATLTLALTQVTVTTTDQTASEPERIRVWYQSDGIHYWTWGEEGEGVGKLAQGGLARGWQPQRRGTRPLRWSLSWQILTPLGQPLAQSLRQQDAGPDSSMYTGTTAHTYMKYTAYAGQAQQVHTPHPRFRRRHWSKWFPRRYER